MSMAGRLAGIGGRPPIGGHSGHTEVDLEVDYLRGWPPPLPSPLIPPLGGPCCCSGTACALMLGCSENNMLNLRRICKTALERLRQSLNVGIGRFERNVGNLYSVELTRPACEQRPCLCTRLGSSGRCRCRSPSTG